MARWLGIVGIGEDGLDGLAPAARALVETAEVLVGGDRHLAMVPKDGRERLGWPRPLTDLIPALIARKDRRVCVLATGNPMFYGVGVTLGRHIPADEMTVVPAPSAFALVCARLGWAQARVDTLTLHGRPVELIHAYVQPGARLVILSEDGASPAAVAAALNARGYGGSHMTVLEHMGGAGERAVSGTAAQWRETGIADLNTIAVECIADADSAPMPRVPGLPDEVFDNDGQLTKREVRAATLASLAPGPGQYLWDVGAGCGSVAIEWMRAHPTCAAVAVERDEGRLGMIAANALALGTPGLDMVHGAAPAALEDLTAPDAVFIGGGATAEGLFEACWDALKPGGRLATNVVTVEGEREVARWRDRVGGEMTRIAVSRAEPVGGFTGWRALMPVTHFAAVKR